MTDPLRRRPRSRSPAPSSPPLLPSSPTCTRLPPSPDTGALARLALPDEMIREGLERMRTDAHAAGRKLVDEGVRARHRRRDWTPTPELRFAVTPWRELHALAEAIDADVIVTGHARRQPCRAGRGRQHRLEPPAPRGPATARGPGGHPRHAGPILAGYDGSDHAKAALEFAARHLPTRKLLVAHAWPVPMVVDVAGRPAAGAHERPRRRRRGDRHPRPASTRAPSPPTARAATSVHCSPPPRSTAPPRFWSARAGAARSPPPSSARSPRASSTPPRVPVLVVRG